MELPPRLSTRFEEVEVRYHGRKYKPEVLHDLHHIVDISILVDSADDGLKESGSQSIAWVTNGIARIDVETIDHACGRADTSEVVVTE